MRTSKTYRITAAAVMATVAAATVVTFARADDSPKPTAAPALPAVSDTFPAPNVSSPEPTQDADPTTAPQVVVPVSPSPSATTATSRSSTRKTTKPKPTHSPSPSPSPSPEGHHPLRDLIEALFD
ncbi:hypothetical protein [Aeromicrobium terrae]|uniref:Uncharacterized protein n=1 Tax=Aeromicrobium terrae TaxID=2498846 RepID=A0A5C8NJU2_9ACTN|nr:hypothetical protein [Aeromicrobium terrae]TXL61307.1 hypothetical protein FHP06_07710 [Aeromicrobium terrae]